MFFLHSNIHPSIHKNAVVPGSWLRLKVRLHLGGNLQMLMSSESIQSFFLLSKKKKRKKDMSVLVAVLLILDSCTLYDSTPSPSFGFFSLWPCSLILLDPIQRLKHDAWGFSLSWGWSFTLGTNSPTWWWTLIFILETLLLLPQLATLSQAQELLRNSFTALMSNLLSPSPDWGCRSSHPACCDPTVSPPQH